MVSLPKFGVFLSGKLNIAMENPPFEDVFPIGRGGFPLPAWFTGG